MNQQRFPTIRRISRWCVRVAPRVGFGLLVLFVLVAIPWTYFNIEWGRELESKLAELKAQGMPLTMAEAARRDVRDAENAAVLYQRVFKVNFELHPPASEPMTSLSSDEWQAVQEYCEHPPQARDKHIAQLLARPDIQETLAALRRASQRKYCVFPVNWEDGFDVVFPHMARFRKATWLVAAKALHLGDEGRVDEALDWCAVGLAMSQHAASDPTLIGSLFGIAMQAITFEAVEKIVSTQPVDPASVQHLEKYLRKIDLYETYSAAMQAERAWGREAFDVLDDHPDRIYKLASEVSESTLPNLLIWLYCTWLGQPLYRLDQLTYLEYMGRQIEVTRQPYRRAKAAFASFRRQIDHLPRYLVVSDLFFPVFSRATQRRDVGVAKIGLCRVALALKAYKYEHGAYPETLDELQETLDWKLPEDPFSGQDFVYQHRGDGFILYSIGQDLEDDGGMPFLKYRYQREPRGYDGDIVWECSR